MLTLSLHDVFRSERVVLIGTSTGALLATMAALEDNSSRFAALVLLSPNFRIRDWRAKFISGPLGRLFAHIVIGREYSFRPDSRGHAEFWTSRFPAEGIVALMDLMNYARSIHLDNLKTPTLIIYTDRIAWSTPARSRTGSTKSRERRS